MIFIGTKSRHYQSFVQIYVRQSMGKVASPWRVSEVSDLARFMSEPLCRSPQILLAALNYYAC